MIKEVGGLTNLTKIITWSDGCVAQFRSSFVFKLLASYCNLQLAWNYNEAHHGKGPTYGIGGTIKNVVFRQVKYGRDFISSAEEFSVAANKFMTSIATLFQREKDLLCEPDDINQLPSIPATLQIHKFVWSSTAEGRTISDFYFLSVMFRKEMWSRGEGLRVFSNVSIALRLLYEKVFRGK